MRLHAPASMPPRIRVAYDSLGVCARAGDWARASYFADLILSRLFPGRWS